MKKSLTKQILILSLTAIVVAGSGCERRGRAPKKTDPAGGTTVTDTAKKDLTPEEKEAEEKKIAEQEKTIIESKTQAAMDCSLALSGAELSADSFKVDQGSLNAYTACAGKNGVEIIAERQAVEPAAVREDGSPLQTITAKFKSETLKATYQSLACATNEDEAFQLLSKRLLEFQTTTQVMYNKYDNSKLDPATSVKIGDVTYYLEDTQKVLQLVPGAVEKAIEELKATDLTPEGADLCPKKD
jgi:hypothetical protein